ncbi:hypothetical protein PRUPE_8G070600 [Prunus persica]|uniref:Uncharacterized protein n=1 Tax=Prunus persica TaxID=3760 RepID=A0A251MUE0_PRUPE|nr:hypothetical protein PRUPE_8G070600 [Prunus persica]
MPELGLEVTTLLGQDLFYSNRTSVSLISKETGIPTWWMNHDHPCDQSVIRIVLSQFSLSGVVTRLSDRFPLFCKKFLSFCFQCFNL